MAIEKLPLDDCILVAQTRKKFQFLIYAWPLTLKYPCANMSPNLFLQKYKQQYLVKLKEVKTPWVLVGTSNIGRSITAYWFRQLNIFWYVLDFWPLKKWWNKILI